MKQRYGRRQVEVCTCPTCRNARNFFLLKYLKNRGQEDMIVCVTHVRKWDSLAEVERLQRVRFNKKMKGWQNDPGPEGCK